MVKLMEDGSINLYMKDSDIVIDIISADDIRNCLLLAIPAHKATDKVMGIELTDRPHNLRLNEHEVKSEVSLRFIMPISEVKKFSLALARVYPAIDQSSLLGDARLECESDPESVVSVKKGMLTKHVDDHHKAAAMQAVIAKRGAFHSIPMITSNDLIHGSWWYLWGSLISVFICLVVLVNDYYTYLGQDDSVLPSGSYRIAWGLCLASSVFFTVGSVPFIRACNSPPLPVHYSLPCMKSHEIYGLWFMLMAVFPVVPYCFVYLAVASESLYLYAMIAALVVIFVMFAVLICVYRSPEVPTSSFMHSSYTCIH
jgi:hypothetical protein